MKTSVLDFIDSDTLREHLSNQTLEPAIECILIVCSRRCTIEKKLEALKERYDTYSEEDFKTGRYWLYRANSFKAALKKHIDAKEKMLVKMFGANDDYVYTIRDACGGSNNCVYRSLNSAMDTLRTNDDTKKIIVKTKLDRSYSYNQIELYLNEDAIPYDIQSRPYDQDDCPLQLALFSIPHCYSKGDMIKRKSDNSYAVITDILDPVHGICNCGMRVKVITIKNDTSKCSGVLLYQEAYPLIDVEYCNADEAADCNEELVKLSILIKQGYDIVDCLALSGYFMITFSEIAANSIKKVSEFNECYYMNEQYKVQTQEV